MVFSHFSVDGKNLRQFRADAHQFKVISISNVCVSHALLFRRTSVFFLRSGSQTNRAKSLKPEHDKSVPKADISQEYIFLFV